VAARRATSITRHSTHWRLPDRQRSTHDVPLAFGLGSILRQEINIKNGRVAESNFHDFPLPRIDEMPKVETVLVPTGGFWGCHGGPAILPLTPAACNAIFAARGTHIRSLPLRHHDFRGREPQRAAGGPGGTPRSRSAESAAACVRCIAAYFAGSARNVVRQPSQQK
jgi:hypothetical protein